MCTIYLCWGQSMMCVCVQVVMDVDSVDYLHLKENTRISFTSSESGGKREWNEQPINP